MGKKTEKKKGKGKVKEEAVVPVKEDKTPGFGCLYLGDKELQRYGFKTGLTVILTSVTLTSEPH